MLALKLLLFNRKIDSNKCFEGLGFDHFYMQSQGNALVKNCTEVFYMIHKGDVE
jgi:hypothetical protein